MMGKSHDEWMIERFQADPTYAATLVNSIIESGDDQGELNVILAWIAAAGLHVSPVSVAPEPKPAARKRARPVAAKAAKRPAAKRRRAGRAAAVVA